MAGIGNPLFGGGGTLSQIMQVVNTIQQLKQNPAGVGQLLYDRNKITQAQLEEINKMNGDMSQIGNYLINSQIMNPQEANQLYSSVPQVQQVLNSK